MAITAEQPAQEQLPEEPLQFFIDEARAEVPAVDIGQLGHSDDERLMLRYLRRRAQIQAEVTHIKEQTTSVIRELEARLKGLDYAYLMAVEHVAAEMLQGQKQRSIKTPFGTVGFRRIPARLEVKDEAALLKAAESDVDLMPLVRVRTEANRAALAEHFKASGEIPPGCDVLPETDKFYVK